MRSCVKINCTDCSADCSDRSEAKTYGPIHLASRHAGSDTVESFVSRAYNLLSQTCYHKNVRCGYKLLEGDKVM